MKSISTKEEILKEGRSLLQKHGYHGFSFQDIADKINIKKPSLYDHFASKDQLTVAIIKNYSTMFDNWVPTMAGLSSVERIRKVFDVFYLFSCDKRKICPVMSLIADFQTLSKDVQREMNDFVEKWLSWVEIQIKDGQKSGQIRKDMDSKTLASFIYSQGMGAQFQARLKNDPELTLSAGNTVVAFIRS